MPKRQSYQPIDDISELLQRYQTGERDFMRAELQGARLSQVDLSEVNLMVANLSRTNLSQANLQGADLFEANLVGADLSGANLRGVDLRDTNLEKAYVFGAVYDQSTRFPVGFDPIRKGMKLAD
jgi:uncharacterized protein YjbI with pentapeptide repeats